MFGILILIGALTVGAYYPGPVRNGERAVGHATVKVAKGIGHIFHHKK